MHNYQFSIINYQLKDMAWFKRTEKGITTATEDKRDVPKGLWYKSPTGKIIDQDELARNLWVSPEDASSNLLLKVISPSRIHFLGS